MSLDNIKRGLEISVEIRNAMTKLLEKGYSASEIGSTAMGVSVAFLLARDQKIALGNALVTALQVAQDIAGIVIIGGNGHETKH